MKFASTLFAALIIAAATSPAMAETSKKLECPPVKTLDKVTTMVNLAALDMMSVRSNLKKAGLKPEDIGSSEAQLLGLENEISKIRAEVGLCQTQNSLTAITQMAAQ